MSGTDNTAPPPPPDTSGTDAERIGRLETGQQTLSAEQQRQGSILTEIRDSLLGGNDTGHVTTGSQPPAGPDPGAMAEQMRQAVRDVQAEAAAAAPPRAPEPETPPREVLVKGKAKLQRALFGGDPK